jgi:hypothetical protein
MGTQILFARVLHEAVFKAVTDGVAEIVSSKVSTPNSDAESPSDRILNGGFKTS